MKFHCPGCQAAFTVPDEKIPEGKGVRILCPRCRTPIELKEKIPSESGAQGDNSMEALSPEGAAAEYLLEEMSVDVVEEGVKTALVCISDPSRSERAVQTLRQLNFFVVPAPKVNFALNKLQHNHYDLVVLDEAFDTARLSENLVFHHIQLLPMHLRRQFFLCLLSDSQPTLDQMLAFRMGVEMILNNRDMEKMKILLARAMKDHASFYRVFNEEMGRKGQL